jgi:hypothetical protein
MRPGVRQAGLGKRRGEDKLLDCDMSWDKGSKMFGIVRRIVANIQASKKVQDNKEKGIYTHAK